MADIQDLRRDYAREILDESQVASDPFVQFEHWFAEARSAELLEPNAMTLATSDADGRPSARIVLLKGFDANGFVFFTNYESRKAHDIDAHPFASLLFYWGELERQVRIEGRIVKVSPQESDEYYAKRPLTSRIGAHVSPQSKPIEGRLWLEQQMEAATTRLGEQPPRPAHWGGYRVLPDRFEYWQGRPSRLHDRIVYLKRNEDGRGVEWERQRLAP